MIKETMNSRGCIEEIYMCSECNSLLFDMPDDEDKYDEWKFCPFCGKPIDFDNIREVA